jgi:ADP-heptose:LPS heptosyltransferase
VLLVCRAEDADAITARSSGVETLNFPQKLSFRGGYRLWRRIRKFKPKVSCAVFSGRPMFRWAKVLFLLSTVRRQLIFNASLDGYWLNFLTWPRLFRTEPLAFEEVEPFAHEVLLLETEGTSEMLEALAIVRRPHVVPQARITVFCAAERMEVYQGQPDVHAVVTYKGGAVFANLWKLRKFMGRRPDVIAAVFSGRRVFLKHKLLFWLIPARGRLAFNEVLDCFYVRWGNLGNFRRNRRFGSNLPLWRSILLPPAKVLLFLPRFVYLLLWARIQRLNR